MERAVSRRTLLGSAALASAGASLFLLALIVIAFFVHLVRTGFGVQSGAVLEESDGPIWQAVLILFVIIPGSLLIGWREFTRGLKQGMHGAAAGLAYGLWALSCSIVVPYLGVYPVIWAGIIHMLLFGWANQGMSFWVTLYVLHLALCPLACALFFSYLYGRRRSIRSS